VEIGGGANGPLRMEQKPARAFSTCRSRSMKTSSRFHHPSLPHLPPAE
jgi:hypothetical protein